MLSFGVWKASIDHYVSYVTWTWCMFKNDHVLVSYRALDGTLIFYFNFPLSLKKGGHKNTKQKTKGEKQILTKKNKKGIVIESNLYSFSLSQQAVSFHSNIYSKQHYYSTTNSCKIGSRLRDSLTSEWCWNLALYKNQL